jgi:hypothetical protein
LPPGSLLHFNGENDATTTVDESGKSWTMHDGAKLSTTQKKFGVSSCYFDGTNDYLSTPSSDDFNFGSGDFTVDWWEYRFTDGGAKPAIGRSKGINYGGWVFGDHYIFNEYDLLIVYMSSSGTSWDIKEIGGYGAINGNLQLGNTSSNEWVHLAVVRSGNTFYGFKNGVLQSYITSANSIISIDSPLTIGTGENRNYFGGYIDEMRISKGIARWTSNFTPPTSEG